MRTSRRGGVARLARLLNAVGLAIVAVLVLYILLTLLDANPENSLATRVRQLAELFGLGMANLFLPADPKLVVPLNYGMAALLWLLITAVVVRLVRRAG